eukprot:10061327-Ditylum_brightwellii.AAC.1
MICRADNGDREADLVFTLLPLVTLLFLVVRAELLVKGTRLAVILCSISGPFNSTAATMSVSMEIACFDLQLPILLKCLNDSIRPRCQAPCQRPGTYPRLCSVLLAMTH